MSPSCVGQFFTPRQILDDPAALRDHHEAPVCAALTEAATYISTVLTAPDRELGRSGAVCPFVGSALLNDMITLVVLPMRTPDEALLRSAALSIKGRFGAPSATMSKVEGLRAVVVLMPNLDAATAGELVETVQKALKPVMVENDLMIGEFYPGCSAPGLNNPAFRPQSTSFACLAIRRVTLGDLPFLIEDSDFVDSYIARFGDEGRRRLAMLRPAITAGYAASALDAAVVAQLAAPASTGLCPVRAS